MREPRIPVLVRAAAKAVLAIALAAAAGLLALICVPRAFGYSPVIVAGGSMAPAVSRGSLVLARSVEPSDVRVGDVIIVRATSSEASPPLLHRVVALRHREGVVVVRTQGDANDAPDVGWHALTGATPRLAAAVGGVGFLAVLVATPLGWFLSCVLPSAIVAAWLLARIWGWGGRRGEAVRVPSGVGGDAALAA